MPSEGCPYLILLSIFSYGAREPGRQQWMGRRVCRKLFFLVLLAVAVVCGASTPLFMVSGNALKRRAYVRGVRRHRLCGTAHDPFASSLLAIWIKPQKKR